MDLGVVLLIAIPVVLIWLYWVYRKKFKSIVVPCVCMATGAPKSGKDLLQADLAAHAYKVNYYVWKLIRCPLCKLMKKPIPEMPLFYVNQPFSFGNLHSNKRHKLDVNIRYITKELLLRQERPSYKSIVWISELTLVADNMMTVTIGKSLEEKKDIEITVTKMTMFCKLFGHMTHGGKLFCNTQNLLDSAYPFKRVCSSFLFNQKMKKFPFFNVIYVREMISKDNDAVNNVSSDADNDMKIYLVPKSVYKHYDMYFLSYLTDNLPISDKREYEKRLISWNKLYMKYADACANIEEEKKEKKL